MDVEIFILEISNLLRLITAAGNEQEVHINLMTHLLNELRTSNIPVFQQEVLRWQEQYAPSNLQKWIHVLILFYLYSVLSPIDELFAQ